MTFVIVLVVAVLIAGWLAMTFNRLVAMRNRMRGAWADVVVFERDLTLAATYVEGEQIVEYA